MNDIVHNRANDALEALRLRLARRYGLDERRLSLGGAAHAAYAGAFFVCDELIESARYNGTYTVLRLRPALVRLTFAQCAAGAAYTRLSFDIEEDELFSPAVWAHFAWRDRGGPFVGDRAETDALWALTLCFCRGGLRRVKSTVQLLKALDDGRHGAVLRAAALLLVN